MIFLSWEAPLLGEFEIGVDQMRGDQSCTQLGEVPFYGTRGHCTWAPDFCKRNRGR